MSGKKTEPARGKVKATPGFEAALHAAGRSPAPDREEKKPRPSTGTEEALLVSRSLTPHARPASLIVTKTAELKVEPKVQQQAKVITLDQLAARSKEQHAPVRLSGPTEQKASRAVEPTQREHLKDSKRADEPTAPIATSTPVIAAPVEPFKLETPNALKEAAPLAPMAPVMNDDPSLRVVLLPTVARMSMDTGEAGRIHVQLKVQDGVTEVRASGPAAQLLESRQGELRVALAKEGLALGHFDLTQSGSQQRHSERPELDVSPPPTARRAATSQEAVTEGGRVHVKA